MEDQNHIKGAVRFDEFVVALTSLDLLLHCMKTVKDKATYWQWIYISLHNTVQAYMVLALTSTHSLWTYKEKDMQQWLTCYYGNRNLPDVQLDFFLSLYEKTKSSDFVFKSNSIIFVPSERQNSNIKELNKFRNIFTHYLPSTTFHNLGESPFQLVTDCLDYIEFLAFQSNNIIWHNEQYKTETEKLLSECRSVIEASDKIVGGR